MSKVISIRLSDDEFNQLGKPTSSDLKKKLLSVNKCLQPVNNVNKNDIIDLKHLVSDIDNRLKILELSNKTEKPLELKERNIDDVIVNDLTFYCSYCKSLKSFKGRKKTNENKFACSDCVNKLTPDEQQL